MNLKDTNVKLCVESVYTITSTQIQHYKTTFP